MNKDIAKKLTATLFGSCSCIWQIDDNHWIGFTSCGDGRILVLEEDKISEYADGDGWNIMDNFFNPLYSEAIDNLSSTKEQVAEIPGSRPLPEVVADKVIRWELALEANLESKSAVIESDEYVITASADVFISKLIYKGEVKRTQSDEYVEVSNRGEKSADISGWKLTSAGSAKQVFIFPEQTVLEPGKPFRIYTNEVHHETGGFSFASKTAIWNDNGDELSLLDATGKKVATLAYGSASVK